MPSRRLPPRYRLLLAANLAFCVAGLFTGLPSWRMFESIPDPRYTLTDAAGAAVRAEDWLPRDAYSFSPQTLANVARFVCERDAAPAPLSLESGGRRFTITRDGDGCVSRESLAPGVVQSKRRNGLPISRARMPNSPCSMPSPAASRHSYRPATAGT